jgi:tetratricopeptide (TPR) repeat protein
MDWWVWLGIIAAIIGILSAIDRWFRPLFRPLLSRIFKRGGASSPKSIKNKDILPSDQMGGSKEVPISLFVPEQPAGIKRIAISATIEYVDGLPTAHLGVRKLFEQARELKNKKEYKKAVLLFEECLELAYSPEQRVALYNQIGRCYWYLSRYDQATNYYKRAKKLAAKVEDKEGLKAALWNLGATYRRKGKNDEAIQCFNNAIKILRDIGGTEEQAILMVNMGNAYEDQGKLQKALTCFKDALALAQKIEEKEGEGYALYFLGGYYYTYQHEVERPLDYFGKAHRIFKETQNKEYEARVLWIKGLMHIFLEEFEKALDCYNSALIISKETKDRFMEAMSLDYMALAYWITHDEEKALEYLEQSSKIEMDQIIEAERSRHQTFMGIYYGMKGEREKATKYFKQSRDKNK